MPPAIISTSANDVSFSTHYYRRFLALGSEKESSLADFTPRFLQDAEEIATQELSSIPFHTLEQKLQIRECAKHALVAPDYGLLPN